MQFNNVGLTSTAAVLPLVGFGAPMNASNSLSKSPVLFTSFLPESRGSLPPLAPPRGAPRTDPPRGFEEAPRDAAGPVGIRGPLGGAFRRGLLVWELLKSRDALISVPVKVIATKRKGKDSLVLETS